MESIPSAPATPPLPPSTPKRQYAATLTRDQRIQIHTLKHTASWTPRRISSYLNITIPQIYYALHHRLTPQKHRRGRKSILNTPHRAEIIRFMTSSKRIRRLRYIEVIDELGLNISETALRNALAKEGKYSYPPYLPNKSIGYHRRIARRKPPISEANRQTRLAWALAHRDWTRQ